MRVLSAFACTVLATGCGGGSEAGDSGTVGIDAASSGDAGAVAVVDDGGAHATDAAVGSDSSEPDGPPASARTVLHGYAQKGPFVAGSQVAVIAVDEELFPTGTAFFTETVGALGEYELRSLSAGYYQIDVTGETRDPWGEIAEEYTLRAVAPTDVAGGLSACVSVVTHLTTPRVRVLVRGGMTVEDARYQAEGELLTGLDVTIPGFDPRPVGTDVVETDGDTPAARFVMLVSVIAAALSPEYGIDEMADDLRDGTMADAHALVLANAGFGWGERGYVELTANWAGRGLPVPPDIRAILDSDQDELGDLDDNCPYAYNDDQQDLDADGRGDVCDPTPGGGCDPGFESRIWLDRVYCLDVCTFLAGECGGGANCQFPVLVNGEGLTVCLDECDPLAVDPCPDGFTCSPGSTLRRSDGLVVSSCFPNPRGVNTDSECRGLPDTACIDGFGCVRHGMTTAPRCRRVCDPDAPAVCAGRPCYGLAERDYGFCADP